MDCMDLCWIQLIPSCLSTFCRIKVHSSAFYLGSFAPWCIVLFVYFSLAQPTFLPVRSTTTTCLTSFASIALVIKIASIVTVGGMAFSFTIHSCSFLLLAHCLALIVQFLFLARNINDVIAFFLPPWSSLNQMVLLHSYCVSMTTLSLLLALIAFHTFLILVLSCTW